MPAFTFRLQTLLDQKCEMETKAKAAVVEKQRIVDEQRATLLNLVEGEKRIESSILRTHDDLLMVAVTNIGADIQRKNDYLAALRKDLSAAHERTLVQKFAVEEAEIHLGDARTYALECFREAEKLSRYRDKLEKCFLAAAAKQEQLEQDELGTTMYLSGRAGV